jgi:hypothetical protein
LHAGVGYVTPDDNTKGAARASAKPAVTDSPRPAKHGSTTVEPQPRNHDDHHPILAGYFIARLLH